MSRREQSQKFVKDERLIHWRAMGATETLSTGDGKDYFHVHPKIVGYRLIDVQASVDDPSSSSGISLQLHSMLGSQDLMSTAITIDSGEYSSEDAATAPVINNTYAILVKGDRLRADVDADGNGASGLVYHLTIRNY